MIKSTALSLILSSTLLCQMYEVEWQSPIGYTIHYENKELIGALQSFDYDEDGRIDLVIEMGDTIQIINPINYQILYSFVDTAYNRISFGNITSHDYKEIVLQKGEDNPGIKIINTSSNSIYELNTGIICYLRSVCDIDGDGLDELLIETNTNGFRQIEIWGATSTTEIVNDESILKNISVVKSKKFCKMH